MAAKTMMFVDTSKCIGCRSCQVACKQWHSLPAETTSFSGSYTNPTNLSKNTLTLVKFTEFVDSRGKLHFFMMKRQCMHCNQAKCQVRCPKGVEKTGEGFVVFNEYCTPENVRLKRGELPANAKQIFLDCCPYGIPSYDTVTNTFHKCDFCFNRFDGGCYTCNIGGKPTTACELTCPAGAVVTGLASTITALSKSRLTKVKKQYNKATLWGGRGRVIYLLTEKKSSYGLIGL